MPDIVLATGQAMPHGPAAENLLLLDALHRRGVSATVEPWGSPATTEAALVVVRTTWDYTDRIDDFLAWVRRTGSVTTLANPPDVIVWNSHKTYLSDLAAAGVPVVPTVIVTCGSSDRDRAAALAAYDGEIVIKPAIAVGADRTIRVEATAAEAADHLAGLTQVADALVQPFQAAIVGGEVSLMYLGGRFSHAVRKVPARGDFRVQVFYGGAVQPHGATAAEQAVANAALAAVTLDLAYARVDLVETADGPTLMELELIEPQLFLEHPQAAVDDFADHLVGLLGHS